MSRGGASVAEAFANVLTDQIRKAVPLDAMGAPKRAWWDFVCAAVRSETSEPFDFVPGLFPCVRIVRERDRSFAIEFIRGAHWLEMRDLTPAESAHVAALGGAS